MPLIIKTKYLITKGQFSCNLLNDIYLKDISTLDELFNFIGELSQ